MTRKKKIIIKAIIFILIGLCIVFVANAIVTPGTLPGRFIFHMEKYTKEDIIKDFYNNKIDFENILSYVNRYNAQFNSSEGYYYIGLYKNILSYQIFGIDEKKEIKMNLEEKLSLIKLFDILHYNNIQDSPRYQNEHNKNPLAYNTLIFEMDDYDGDNVHGIMYIYDGKKPVEWESGIYLYEHLDGNWYYWEGGWDEKKSI